MVCPKIKKLCRTCKWDEKNDYKNGELDKCKCPKNPLEEESNDITCYISGKTKDSKKFKREWCIQHRDSKDYLRPGVDICGREGLWWESNEKKWWEVWKRHLTRWKMMNNYGHGTREVRTSSFFASKGNPLGVSIANSAPDFYRGPTYRPLVPFWELAKNYKDGKVDVEGYTDEYYEQLMRLDPQEVYDELFEIHNENPVLLCWEPAGEFCHRRIVAEWLRDTLGIEVSVG